MTLISPLAAYRNNNKEIDYYYIEMLLRISIKNGYSNELTRCVEECVKIKNRPTVKELLTKYSSF